MPAKSSGKQKEIEAWKAKKDTREARLNAIETALAELRQTHR